jgi:hypothetical protein
VRRIDEEFRKEVEERAEQRAVERLGQLKSVEWPRWYRLNVEPRIRELESKVMRDALAMLKGPWNVICDRCGVRFQVELTASGIEELLRNSSVWVECANPSCKDFWAKHRIQIHLKDLIAARISEAPTTGI